MTPDAIGKPAEKDCIGCRLVGGGGCLGASLYVYYHASRNTSAAGRFLGLLFAGGMYYIEFFESAQSHQNDLKT